MSTKFFNNTGNNTLFDKFKGLAEGMGLNFNTFQAVSGYFRSSGYFKLRAELKNVQKIQILVGINIDDIFRGHNRAEFFLGASMDDAKKLYTTDFIQDVREAGYSEDIEKGILQMCEDLATGKLEMRIHSTGNLHAKFYLCLPENHSPNSDGWVIMGSSNISDSGLGVSQSPRYELNVALKDYDDVKFCRDEFENLWRNAVPLSIDDIAKARKETHLGVDPTPYELYMKVLIDTFGDQAEDEFSLSLPEGFMDLKYQKDAVIQGYQMLRRHNGFFLADVVGLGKTIVAAMIARRFTEENGLRNTHILVIYPPAVEHNWKETFNKFGLRRYTQFVSNGSLSKILRGEDNYRAKEEFDLIIVDESHNFRNSGNDRYDELQRICKAPRRNRGFVTGSQKKVILVSATALNNGPRDLLAQILLFQDARRSTIDGISNIQNYFAPQISAYKRILSRRIVEGSIDVKAVDAIYEKIRRDILEKITVRRTRSNILNDDAYKSDLTKQGIRFPTVTAPHVVRYEMADELDTLFWDTFKIINDEITYARYRAIEFLKPEFAARYGNAKHIASTLAGVYRVHMVKRLESSFYAFRKSLETFERITKDMIGMYNDDKVLIIPEMDVKSYQAKGWELDKIIETALERYDYKDKSQFVYPASAFDDKFLEMLQNDLSILGSLREKWEKVDNDPKFERFVANLGTVLVDHKKNPTGKLVVFSESVDTIEYLTESLVNKLGRNDVLTVSSKNRGQLKKIIRENFDANYDDKKDDYNIILTSDVLAEGINLHRANVIVNYDSPWNTSRLMQRIGRVNRIGSVAGEILNFMYYPSDQGNRMIGLYQNALAKMQGFHSALGEDIQIFSIEELVREFKMFDPDVLDSVDETLKFLRIVRDLFTNNRSTYERIKALPRKCRVLRKGSKPHSVAFVSSSRKTAYFLITDNKAEEIDFIEAAKILKAEPDEKALAFDGADAARHYHDIRTALDVFETAMREGSRSSGNAGTINLSGKNKIAGAAFGLLRKCRRWIADGKLPAEKAGIVDDLVVSVSNGTFVHLERSLANLAKEIKSEIAPPPEQIDSLMEALSELHEIYMSVPELPPATDGESDPVVIVSETFVTGC